MVSHHLAKVEARVRFPSSGLFIERYTLNSYIDSGTKYQVVKGNEAVVINGRNVKVNDNYKGDLENVKGRIGKVIAVDGDNFLIDINGDKLYPESSYHSAFYMKQPLILKENEFDIVEYEMLDGNGRKIQLGHNVVYGPLRGGVIQGKVVDFKTTKDYYGKEVTKFQLEIQVVVTQSDGSGRTVRHNSVYRQWFSCSHRALVIDYGRF